MPVVLFTKDIMDADKPATVVSIPPVRFIFGPKNQGRTGNIKVVWDIERYVSVITTVGVIVEKYLVGIGMSPIHVVIHMEFDGKEYCVRSLG